MALAPEFATELESLASGSRSFQTRGFVSRVVGMLIYAQGVHVEIGEMCQLRSRGKPPLFAEVVGFFKQSALLSPYGSAHGISALTEVIPLGRPHSCAMAPELLGRVIDGFGQPLDGRPPIQARKLLPVHNAPPNPLARQLIDTVFHTGVRAVDGLLTVGRGQRVGIFAPAGTGKSTLLSMLVRNSSADVVVIALVGERGREVREFFEVTLDEEARKRSVLVVTTSDKPAMERAKCTFVATTIAEYFRDQGKNVLLLVDSLTRFARAQREIGLAAGEPPTRRSYPPSLFAVLPTLLERAGCSDKGAITAFYTVLSESDLEQDPVAEEVRSILDGHIILSRKIAAANQYPAIDLLASLSRVMTAIVSREQIDAAGQVRHLLAKYEEVELLVQIGEYKAGTDPVADQALAARADILAFAAQKVHDSEPLESTRSRLLALVPKPANDQHHAQGQRRMTPQKTA